MTKDTMRPWDGPVRTDGGQRVGAVLLAAGLGSRFEGGNKLLTPVDGTPLVRHAAETVLDAAVADVVVIVGHDRESVRDALSGLPVSFRANPDYAEGQSTSVRAGVEAARERNWDATVFALGDMPFVSPTSVDALLDRYARGDVSIAAAAHAGQRGNPVLFDSTHYETLADVRGDVGGRQLIEEREDVALVETDDPGVTRDIDDEADLSRYTG
jgi:molybdenum cofactor cytidylyltransferase